jgi:hypothetical protein
LSISSLIPNFFEDYIAFCRTNFHFVGLNCILLDFRRFFIKKSTFFKFYLFPLLSKYLTFMYKLFFSKIQDGAHIQYGVFFWHLLLEALKFVRNFKMEKFLQFLKEQTPKKNIKKCFQKFNSKWPLHSRWRPKLHLLVKLQVIFFQKKNSGRFSCFLSFKEIFFSQKFKMAPIFNMEIFFGIFF